MNEVQAGGVNGGIADARVPETPCSISWARLGNLLWAIQGRIKSQVAESRPKMNILGFSIASDSSFAAYRRPMVEWLTTSLEQSHSF